MAQNTPYPGATPAHVSAPASQAESKLVWRDALLLGHPPMDETHEEFVTCVRALLAARGEAILEALAAFERHARRHFDEEDAWMNDTGFPATGCHADEHAAVLKSVHEFQHALAQGTDPSLAHDLARELARWFPGHADYMDASLAQWMVKRRHGGAPVVLKRGMLDRAVEG